MWKQAKVVCNRAPALLCTKMPSYQQPACTRGLISFRSQVSMSDSVLRRKTHYVSEIWRAPFRRFSDSADPNDVNRSAADNAASHSDEVKSNRKIHKRTMADLDEVVQVVRDDNCLDVVTIDVRPRTPQCDFFVIATCRAGRHMKAVAETLGKQFKDRRRKGETLVIEGDVESQWIIVNMSDIQVHLMDSAMRQRLELEKLWTLGPDDDQLRMLIDSRPEYFI